MHIKESNKESAVMPKKHNVKNLSRGHYWREHLKFTMARHARRGFEFPAYDYMTAKVRSHINHMFRELERMGVVNDEVRRMLKTTGVTTKDLNKKLEGKMTIHLWEYLEWMEALGYTLEKPVLTRKLYTHSFEGNKDEYKCRLIIQRNYEPKFFINIAPYEPKDFEIDFSDCKLKERPGEVKVKQVVIEALLHYYGTTDKLPLKERTLKNLIRQKFYAGEIKGASPKI